jgi:hypothetical protein
MEKHKNNYIEVTYDKETCYMTLSEAHVFLESIACGYEGENEYTFKLVKMTQAEFEELPEFIGF